jgi:ferredoxin
MYPEYNLMAGGHNTRASKRDRFRNRFLHKLEFFRERYGTFSCSGCGRCLVMCPNGISIVSVINRFGEVDPDVS